MTKTNLVNALKEFAYDWTQSAHRLDENFVDLNSALRYSMMNK